MKDVIAFEGEKNGVPVEVAMVYNTSYSENLHSYVNNTKSIPAIKFTFATITFGLVVKHKIIILRF